jgi:CHAT domain-containing protein
MEDPAVRALRDARLALDEVVAEIQQVPGFEDFLATPTFDDVAQAAGEQPLAYVAAAEHGGIALVVRGNEVAHIDLPDLAREPVDARARQYLDRYADFRASPEHRRKEWDAMLADITSWLWPRLMDPLLSELGDAEAVTLVPGGLLGLLPLHAAWRPDSSHATGREHAMDRLVISYAPNARSLSVSRAAAERIPSRRVLAVATPGGPGASRPLPLAIQECRAACGSFPSDGTMLHRNLTVESVAAAMGAADVVHFACHGYADLAVPLDSGLILADGQVLTVRELMSRDLRVRLAVLSACETLVPGTELPDEVVSLPTGLLQAGAAGVIASLWTVPDLESAALMVEFYGRWRTDGVGPAQALRDAQVWIRDTPLAEKIALYKSAANGLAGWPPAAVADALLDRIARLPAAASGPADLVGWAAFAHVGV